MPVRSPMAWSRCWTIAVQRSGWPRPGPARRGREPTGGRWASRLCGPTRSTSSVGGEAARPMLFRNTLAQSASVAVGYLFSFLLAPIMIARLGLDSFGVWAVTGAFATYAGLLDLGIGRSLARFIAV